MLQELFGGTNNSFRPYQLTISVNWKELLNDFEWISIKNEEAQEKLREIRFGTDDNRKYEGSDMRYIKYFNPLFHNIIATFIKPELIYFNRENRFATGIQETYYLSALEDVISKDNERSFNLALGIFQSSPIGLMKQFSDKGYNLCLTSKEKEINPWMDGADMEIVAVLPFSIFTGFYINNTKILRKVYNEDLPKLLVELGWKDVTDSEPEYSSGNRFKHKYFEAYCMGI